MQNANKGLKVTPLGWDVCKRDLVNIFYHIRRVAAHITKLILGCIWDPDFGERGGRRRSAMVPFKRTIVVSYRLSIVTTMLSLTIRTQFAVEWLWCSNQQEQLWSKIWGGRGWWCKPNFNAIWERSCRMQKKSCRYLLLFEHSARNWQTETTEW